MSAARLSRVLLGTAVLGALISPALVAVNAGGLSLSASSKPVPAEKRKSSPPNVMFPVVSSKAKDLKSYVPSGAEEATFRGLIPLITACVASRLNTPSP